MNAILLMRHVGQIKISILLKIQEKQHHNLYIKIIYKYKYDAKKSSTFKRCVNLRKFNTLFILQMFRAVLRFWGPGLKNLGPTFMKIRKIMQ